MLRSHSQLLFWYIKFLSVSLCNITSPPNVCVCVCFSLWSRPALWIKMLPYSSVTTQLSSFSPQPKAKNLREWRMLKSIEVSSSSRLRAYESVTQCCWMNILHSWWYLRRNSARDQGASASVVDPRSHLVVLWMFVPVFALRTDVSLCKEVIQIDFCFSLLILC